MRPRSSEITALERAALRLEPADDARPAAERHDRHAGLRARLEHRQHLVVVGGRHDRVGRVLAVARALGQQVEVGLAAAAQHARLAVVAHVARRSSSSRAAQRGVERRLAQPHVLERDRPADDAAVDPELVAQEADRVLGQRRPGARLAPAPEDLLAPHRSAPSQPVERVVELLAAPRGAA